VESGYQLIIRASLSRNLLKNRVHRPEIFEAHVDYITAVVFRRTETAPEYFLVQRPETGLLAGLWDFPNIELDDLEIDEPSSVKTLTAYLESLGLSSLGALGRKGESLHIFTHIRRTSQVYTVEVLDSTLATSLGQWVTEEAIQDMAVSELGRKVLRLALGTEKKRKSLAQDKKPKVKSQKITSFFVKGQ
jgi:A/G-specific adenine glycosylase